MTPTAATKKSATKRKWWRPALVWGLYTLGLAPAIGYFYLGVANKLGADPVKTFEHLLGIWGLRFILLTLCVTPVRDLANVNLLRYRRALGLLGFYYVLMHFLVYLVLDQQMNVSVVIQDVIKRPFITFGMAALALLIPLAITSNHWSIKRLGKKWIYLHKLVYVISILGTVHFAMGRKIIGPEITMYIALAFFLLSYRLIRPQIMEQRRIRKKKNRNAISK